ncbi:MAG: hypothetical protein JO038_09090 [Alphaproteobacteria bacterium]|nr:hypothetical protein [Alphaproteobacteria bacterium]
MQKRSDESRDEALVAYLDGELDSAERREIEAWIAADSGARDRIAALAASGVLVRNAFDDVLGEPVPQRLIDAARGIATPFSASAGASAAQNAEPDARILPFRLRSGGARAPRTGSLWRWPIAVPAAAALAGMLVGGGVGYYGGGGGAGDSAGRQQAIETAANNAWLDNAAADYKLLVSTGSNALLDVPATGDPHEALQKISQVVPQEVRLPDLKPWGLNFRGARLIALEGRPAAQLIYTTDNKAIGPLALIIGPSKQTELQPTFGQRQDLNLLYWRHQGRAYVLVGQTDIGYLWGIANDVAWQLDAI